MSRIKVIIPGWEMTQIVKEKKRITTKLPDDVEIVDWYIDKDYRCLVLVSESESFDPNKSRVVLRIEE